VRLLRLDGGWAAGFFTWIVGVTAARLGRVTKERKCVKIQHARAIENRGAIPMARRARVVPRPPDRSGPTAQGNERIIPTHVAGNIDGSACTKVHVVVAIVDDPLPVAPPRLQQLGSAETNPVTGTPDDEPA
jgi:hypothetical protein